MIGKIFHKLIVESFANKTPQGYAWNCKCECGNTIVAHTKDLNAGRVKSCGCFNFKNNRKKHGLWKTNRKIFNIWNDMIQRVTNPNDSAYHNYGGRGIKICDRWLESPINFLEDMGSCPPNMTLERIDVNGNYCPTNCRWATREEQFKNKRPRGSSWGQLIEIEGQFNSMAGWAKEYGLATSIIKARLKGAKKATKEIFRSPKKPDVFFDGQEYRTISQLSIKTGIPPKTIRDRLKRGWSVLDAISCKRRTA